jgi:hypothetical protein
MPMESSYLVDRLSITIVVSPIINTTIYFIAFMNNIKHTYERLYCAPAVDTNDNDTGLARVCGTVALLLGPRP